MRLLSTLTALALGLVVASSVSAEDKAQKKGKKAAKPVTGVVTEIKKDSDKDTGTITVKVQAKAKKGQTAPEPVEKTFKVTEATKFEKKGKGKKATATEAKFADLTRDARVTVAFKDDVAVSVTILPVAKKKNKQ
jgi:hypothetical protein